MSGPLKVVSLEEQQLSVFGITREEVLEKVSQDIITEIREESLDGLQDMITLPFSVIKALTGFTQDKLETLEHLDIGNRNKRMTFAQVHIALNSNPVHQRKREKKAEKIARLRAELEQLERGKS